MDRGFEYFLVATDVHLKDVFKEALDDYLQEHNLQIVPKNQSQKPTNKDISHNDKAPAYLKTKEVRKILDCSGVTLWRYNKEGLLHPTKVGSKYYYDADEVEQLKKKKYGPVLFSK